MARNGIAYNTPAHRASLKHLKAEIRAKAPRTMYDEPIKVAIDFYLQKPKSAKKRVWPCVRPDLDNYAKLVLDSGNDYLWLDDGCICELHIRKIYGRPRIEVSIFPLGV